MNLFLPFPPLSLFLLLSLSLAVGLVVVVVVLFLLLPLHLLQSADIQRSPARLQLYGQYNRYSILLPRGHTDHSKYSLTSFVIFNGYYSKNNMLV